MKEPLLLIPSEKLDIVKYVRQLRVIVRWKKGGCRGTAIAATGFGKTIIAIIALSKMKKHSPSRKALVVVPTTALKEQWLHLLKEFKLSDITTVEVINTVSLHERHYVTDLLILDEVHLYAADQFQKVFSRVKYHWLLSLTATIERKDGKHAMLEHKAPIIDSISQKECIEKGWISDIAEINLAIPLTQREVSSLNEVDKMIRSAISKFGDFNALRDCMNMGNAKAYAALYYPNDHNDTKAKELLIIAVNGFRLVKRRQEFLYKTERKIDAAVELINEFKLKTIMFSQSTSFADEVALRLGSSAVSYHSGIKTTEQLVTTTTVVKTKKAVDKLVMSDPKAIVKVVIEGYEVTTSKLKKIGPAKYLAKAMDDFTNNLNGVSTICTAKALDTGMDVPDVELGIDASRTSNPTQKIQRTGRVARNYTYEDGTKKKGVYINLYIPNSQDESWLKSCQSKNPDSVIWIDDIDEVKTFVHNLLKK